MKQTLTGLMLAAVLCLGLTACSVRTNDTVTDSGTGATGSQSAGQDMTGDYNNGTGQVGDLNQDEIGNGDAITNDNGNTQAGPESRTAGRSSVYPRRSAYDYLNDGKYEAGKDGMIRDRSDLGKDLTQGARDLIRDAKELGRDMARDVGDAARSAGQAAKDTGKAAGNTVRDKLN